MLIVCICLPAPSCLYCCCCLHCCILLLLLCCSYKPAGGKALPLCATQYFPDIRARGSTMQYSKVTLTTAEPISKANAADLAHAWTRGTQQPFERSKLC